MKKIDSFSKFLILFGFIAMMSVFTAIKYQDEIKTMRYDNFKKFEKVSLVENNKNEKMSLIITELDNKHELNIKEVKSLKDLNKNNLEKKSKIILIGNDFKEKGHIQLLRHLKKETTD